MKDVIRHIIGYSIGIPLFAFVIPYGLYMLSIHDPLIQTNLNNYIVTRTLIALPFLIPGLIFMIWSNVALFSIGKGGPTDGFNIAISPRTKKTGNYRTLQILQESDGFRRFLHVFLDRFVYAFCHLSAGIIGLSFACRVLFKEY